MAIHQITYNDSVITGIAGTTITAGDLISNNENGFLIKCNQSLGVLVENNTTAGPSTVYPIATFESNSNYEASSTSFNKMIELGNGNIAVAYSGDGTTASTDLNVRILSPIGGDAVAKITISENTVYLIRLEKLDGNRFVVSWISDGHVLKFTILNNDGSVNVGTTTVSTLVSSSDMDLTVLTTGDFVFAYSKVTTSDVTFSRYNSSGVLQGSETNVENITCIQVTVHALSGGGFVIVYYDSASPYNHKFAKFDSAGTLVGSIVTISSYNGYLTLNNIKKQFIELANGNIVIADSGTDGYANLYLYDSSNTLVKTIDLGNAATSLYSDTCPGLVNLSDTGFAVLLIVSQDPYTRLGIFDNNGNGVMPFTSVTSAANTQIPPTTANTNIGLFDLGAAGFCIAKHAYNGTNSEVILATIDNAGVTTGSEIIVRAANSGSCRSSNFLVSSSGLFYIYYDDNNTNLKFGVYDVLQRSIIGVAAETKAANETIRVLTNGTYTINQNFSSGGNFDNTSATIPGAKGSVIGNSAILRGTK